MPLDAICLRAVLHELRPQRIGARIDKVQQPARDTVILALRGPGGGGRLLLTALVAGVTLASCAATVYLLSLPQDDALLSAVGGVTPLVTYHRGDCSIAPENTIPAFRSAIRKGGDRIELDVQMSRDGVVVVTHDTSLKRCTGKNAKVYDLTFAEIETLDAGRWFSARFAGTRIPSCEEVLQL